jgi:hypothetical protein
MVTCCEEFVELALELGIAPLEAGMPTLDV